MKIHTNLTKEELSSWLNAFNITSKSYYVCTLVSFEILYIYFAIENNFGIMIMIVGSLLGTLSIIPFYSLSKQFIYRTNIFRSIVLILQLGISLYFTYRYAEFSINVDGANEWQFSLWGNLMFTCLGAFYAVILSVPSKVVHFFLYQENSLYYDTDSMDVLRDKASGVDQIEKERKKKEILYNTYNETELKARLNEAIRQENYEEAERIQKIINNKFE